MQRRHAVEALALLLAGCAAPGSAPAPRVHLPFDAPEAAPPHAPDGQTWQLAEPLRLPTYVDRDTWGGIRWAEPLRDALPRVLRADLGTRRGGRIWGSPRPSGVVATYRLQVEVLAVETSGSALRLVAQWVIEDLRAGSAKPGRADLRVPGEGVAAWRLAIWRLSGAMLQP